MTGETDLEHPELSQEEIRERVDELAKKFDSSDLNDQLLSELLELMGQDERYDLDPKVEIANQDIPVYLRSARIRMQQNPDGEKVVPDKK